MPRIYILALAATLLPLAACSNKDAETSAHVEEPYAPPSANSPYGADPAYTSTVRTPTTYTRTSYSAPSQSLDSMDAATSTTVQSTPASYTDSAADQPLAATGGQTYVVAKGDTFYALARRFYNDQSRWREIWTANQARVPNPDRLPVGTKLIIP